MKFLLNIFGFSGRPILHVLMVKQILLFYRLCNIMTYGKPKDQTMVILVSKEAYQKKKLNP